VAKTDKKQPWFKFYPSDWSGDRKLHMCSIGARGLWIEMVCVMHEADPYGYLITDGKPVTNRQIASLAGISLAECGRYLMELESAGVYSRAENKTIYSRRMVRDKAKAEKDRENGKGGGNPNLIAEDNGGVNPQDKAQIPEARLTNGTETRGASLITPEAFGITTELEQACGFNLPEDTPPGWYGCAMWVQKCLNEGWVGEVMVSAAKSVALRKRNGFVESFKYLEKPLAQAMAEYKAPLPVVEVRQSEKITVTHGRMEKTQSLSDVARRLAEQGLSFGEKPATPSLRSITGGADVRLLSESGSERSGDLCSSDVGGTKRILAGDH
jgi:hypothetical protein